MIAFALLAALAGAQPTEALFEGEPTLEVCLTRPGAGRHSACAPVLEPEVALAPDGLFNTVNATSPGRREGWLGAVCAADRLAPGQTVETCREEAEARLERSSAARVAMSDRPDARGGSRYERLSEAAAAEQARRTVEQWGLSGTLGSEPPASTPADTPDRDDDRCRRRGAEWRDEDTGDSGSSYAIRCSWGSDDPETRRRAGEALDAVMGRD